MDPQPCCEPAGILLCIPPPSAEVEEEPDIAYRFLWTIERFPRILESWDQGKSLASKEFCVRVRCLPLPMLYVLSIMTGFVIESEMRRKEICN